MIINHQKNIGLVFEAAVAYLSRESWQLWLLRLLTVFRLFTNCEFVPRGDEFVCKADVLHFLFLSSFGYVDIRA